MFSWICWIRPDNVVINQLFGVNTGLGMGVLTFDWTQISWIANPLATPWWAQVNSFAGFVFFFWILVPILYYTNVSHVRLHVSCFTELSYGLQIWSFAHFPINSNGAFDKFGRRYNVSRVLTPQNSFDLAGYEEYSPLYLPATFASAYLVSFVLSSCILVHTLFYHGRAIFNVILGRKAEEDDIHAKLMQAYPEVPTWLYACAGVLGFSFSMITTQAWHSGSPLWVPVFSITLVVVYLLPCVMLFATTGYTVGLLFAWIDRQLMRFMQVQVNLLSQIIPGVLAPGNPVANMVTAFLTCGGENVGLMAVQFFKAFAVDTLGTTAELVRDFKLGHYIKVPPRVTFWGVWFSISMHERCL